MFVFLANVARVCVFVWVIRYVLSLLQQRHGRTLWPGSLPEELVDCLRLGDVVGKAECGL